MFDSPLLPRLDGYIDGSFYSSPTTAHFEVRDPATGASLARLPKLGASETRLAVEAASRALPRVPSLDERRRVLEALAAAHRDNRDELARIVTAENGKPLAEARGEVDYAAAFYDEAAHWLDHLAPRSLDRHPRSHRWTVHHRPAGVAGLITPWNFPLAMIAKKLAGTLAAGTPAVIKPAEKTPLSCVALLTMLDGIGLDPGRVNLVFGDAPAIGEVLCAHPAIRVLSFTGSTAIGRLLATQAAPHLKRLSMELGGNAPFIVFDDADLDRAADALVANKFRCSGQTCVCTNRVLVQRGVAEDFSARVSARVAALKVGPGDEPSSDLGPMIDEEGFAKVRAHVADALERGARLRVGALPSEGAGPFFAPVVLEGITSAMACWGEETFGPVVAVRSFADEEDAVALGNDTPHGLAAYVFTQDVERGARVAAKLHFGHVGLNTSTGPTPEAPFGGMGLSGIGREGGLEGILEFCELQTVPTPD